MRDWKCFVRDRLSLPELEECRQRDLVDEVASQLEDLYLEVLDRGRPEEEAAELAAAHIRDWDSFAADLVDADRRNRRSRVAVLAEQSEDSLRDGGGRGVFFADILQDVRYSLRSLKGSPGFTSVALLTLALGIGGVTTIFTLFDHVLLRPLPYSNSVGLVEMWEKMASFDNATVAYPNFLDWRERNRVFEDVAVWNDGSLNLTGGDHPIEVTGAAVSASFTSILGVAPAFGRSFLAEEDTIGGPPAVLLAHRFWQKRFGGDREVLGQTLMLDDTPYTVVGVMPRGFRFPPNLREVDLYAPVERFAEEWIENRGNHPGLLALARLKAGVTIQAARDDMERVALELQAEYPDSNTGSRVHVASLHDRVTRNAKDILVLLLLSVALLMLIACFNVANLVLARATSRMHEMAVRASMGASRARIVRLMLIDSMVLWIAGGVLGLVMGSAGVRVISVLLAEEIPWVFQVGLDVRVAVVTLGIALLTGIVFGIVPALSLSRQDPKAFLIDGIRVAGGVGRTRFRNILVIAEVGLAVALLIGAGLTVRSFRNLTDASPGLSPENVLTVELNLPEVSYPEASERTEFFTGLLDRVREHPGVVSASTSYVVPLGPGGWQNAYHAEGAPPEVGGAQAFAEVSAVSSDYFQTMGIPLIRGRDFTRRDSSDAPPVVIVDEALAEQYWPGENPLGKRVKWGNHDSESQWMEVVGVAGHVMVNGVMQDTEHQLYIPQWQDNDDGYYLMVKTRGNPLDMTGAIRRVVMDLDPTQPLGTIGTMEGWVGDTTRGTRLTALLMTVFSLAAVLLAAVGVFGVMAQMTAERRQEIGIRMALGARGDQVLGLVLRQGLVTISVGLTFGLGLAVLLGRVVAAQLFQVTATDPLTFALAPLLVAAVAAAANLIPARQAMRVDPARVLQAE